MNIYLKFIISIAIPLIIGWIGWFFTTDAISSWYVTLEKPFFNPPNWIFGPVWTILYTMMWISFFLVWKENFWKVKKCAIKIFALQLVLNLAWSIVFFPLESPLWAGIIIVILWAVILKNILMYCKISKVAWYLLIPYLLWVSFATILNFSIIYLN